jgi:hypothetical protein
MARGDNWTRPGLNREPAAEAGGGPQAYALTTAPEMGLASGLVAICSRDLPHLKEDEQVAATWWQAGMACARGGSWRGSKQWHSQASLRNVRACSLLRVALLAPTGEAGSAERACEAALGQQRRDGGRAIFFRRRQWHGRGAGRARDRLRTQGERLRGGGSQRRIPVVYHVCMRSSLHIRAGGL